MPELRHRGRRGQMVEHEKGSTKSKVLHAAAQMFIGRGYEASTMREIAANAQIKYGSLGFIFKSKEAILCELVGYVLDSQFEAMEKLLADKTDDKILFYAAETTLQLYLAESSEHMREMYAVSYSLPNSSKIIYEKITGKLEDIFREHLPMLETKDFYEKEIASAGIMRNFMTVPCNMYFTMDRKVASFLESTFLIYRVPDDKIRECIDFVSRFDYKSIAAEVIDGLLEYLKSKT